MYSLHHRTARAGEGGAGARPEDAGGIQSIRQRVVVYALPVASRTSLSSSSNERFAEAIAAQGAVPVIAVDRLTIDSADHFASVGARVLRALRFCRIVGQRVAGPARVSRRISTVTPRLASTAFTSSAAVRSSVTAANRISAAPAWRPSPVSSRSRSRSRTTTASVCAVANVARFRGGDRDGQRGRVTGELRAHRHAPLPRRHVHRQRQRHGEDAVAPWWRGRIPGRPAHPGATRPGGKAARPAAVSSPDRGIPPAPSACCRRSTSARRRGRWSASGRGSTAYTRAVVCVRSQEMGFSAPRLRSSVQSYNVVCAASVFAGTSVSVTWCQSA